jgi:hypothetical protein
MTSPISATQEAVYDDDGKLFVSPVVYTEVPEGDSVKCTWHACGASSTLYITIDGAGTVSACDEHHLNVVLSLETRRVFDEIYAYSCVVVDDDDDA